jgi:hypothetical protein
MGWEGIHLYEFHVRAKRYGSWELSASSRDITLAALRLLKGARFIYEYDLNIPWCHEVRIEDPARAGRSQDLSRLHRGDGACPPEDCGGPERFMDHRDDGRRMARRYKACRGQARRSCARRRWRCRPFRPRRCQLSIPPARR